MPYPIIARPSADVSIVYANLPSEANALFRDVMFEALWGAGLFYGIDPVGMVAQSGKETNWGTFRRTDGSPSAVQSWMRNTAGIKVRDVTSVRKIIAAEHGVSVSQWDAMTPAERDKLVSPDHTLVHTQNLSWQVGATIQAQHLRAYCGLPFEQQVIDPRWDWVYGKHVCVDWSDLNGRWAGPSYGTEVEQIMDRLR